MLKTERLYLRSFVSGDAAVMHGYRNDDSCKRYQRYEDTSLAYLQEFVRAYADCGCLSAEEQHYAIVRDEDGQMIGDVSVFFSEQERCFTLGITVAPCFQRQGYAYELLEALTLRMRGEYPDFDIVALIEKENEKSIALFKKLGFAEECYAETIQSLVYVLYAEKK